MQNRPEVKSVADIIKSDSHKQKKYISLMVVPSYTGGKTLSIHIPQAVFFGFFALVFAISAIIIGLHLRAGHFAQMSVNLDYALLETQESFDEFQQITEYTNEHLRDTSLYIYSRLNRQQSRAAGEFDRQGQEHQYNFDGVMAHIYFMEWQLRELQAERLELMEFLGERAYSIPPAAYTIRRIEAAQEELLYYFANGEYEPQDDAIGLLGGVAPVSEAELHARLMALADELEVARALFENIEEYKRDIETYLRDFPTLMPIAGGQITSWFGFRRDPITGGRAFHEGVDIPAPMGTPIHAAGGGVVVYSDFRGGYGNVVFIDHGDGLQTRYAHNSQNLVYVGQRVERGDVIAYVGSTGRSISPHLHYEVLRNGSHIDPVPFIMEEIIRGR